MPVTKAEATWDDEANEGSHEPGTGKLTALPHVSHINEGKGRGEFLQHSQAQADKQSPKQAECCRC